MTAARAIGLRLVALGVALVVDFTIPRLLPGDPAAMLVARLPTEQRAEAVAALRDALGLDAGGPWAFARWLGAVLRGDLGVSVARHPEPVLDILLTALPWTALLSGAATALAFLAGSALGVAAARRPGGRVDRLVLPAAVFVGGVPAYVLAMGAVTWLGVGLGWLPTRHAWDLALDPAPTWDFARSVARHAVLPVGTLALGGVGGWAVGMRAAMTAVAGAPHVAFARARGVPEGRVLVVHELRLAMVPQVAGLGLAVGYVVSGALLTELVFGWPGMGVVLLEAVRAQDLPVLQGCFLVLVVMVLGVGALVDAAVSALDPRAREVR